MKKYIVLSVLFVLPLVVYLFFASGVNNFAKLPIVTNTVVDVAEFSDEQFKDKITILGFLGTDVSQKKENKEDFKVHVSGAKSLSQLRG